MARRLTPCILLAAALALGTPATANAQWYVGAYLGANATRPATVRLDLAEPPLALTYDDVHFAGRPFASPQYYGIRIGREVGRAGRFGVEVEFIHAKVIADPIDAIVTRYAMSHGLNFLLVNLVARQPIAGGRAAFVARGGVGPTLPHAETTVFGVEREQYELGGVGWQAAAGVEVALARRLRVEGEYKFTFARPTITVAGGTGRTTAASHQVTFGLAVPFSR
jgi:hypothetical protein